MTEKHVTLAEIAAALGKTKRTVEIRATKESWPYQEEAVRGGKQRQYPVSRLPQDVKNAVALAEVAKHLQAAQTTAVAPVAAEPPVVQKAKRAGPALGGLMRVKKPAEKMNDQDRRYQDSALMLCQAIQDIQATADCSQSSAIQLLAERIVTAQAEPALIAAADVTYLKKRQGGQTVGALSSRLQKMMTCYRQGAQEGECGAYLVAGRREKTGQKHEDVVAFLLHFCKPTGPSISKAWRDAEAWYLAQGLRRPAYDTFIRIENALPVTIKYRGRMTGAAYRALLPYVERDVSMFKANDIWVCDGHTFKARVRSPIHGQPFRPEVTFVLDWVSRKIVGWSVDLAESTIAVSAAYRHAQMMTKARPLVTYTDNGSGQSAKSLDHPITGTLARQGVAHETGIPGNPQGRGVIERLWRSTTIELASDYATSLTHSTDREHIRKTGVAMMKSQRAGEYSELVPAWEVFLEDLEQKVSDYNNRPHSSLDDRTPNEVYAETIDPDSIMTGISQSELDALWMPEVLRSPSRGNIQLFTNSYHRAELVDELAEGEKVRVRYDIHNAEQVWVYRVDGTLIGTAKWDGNKRAAFPVPHIEEKRLERAEGKRKLAERDIALAEAELTRTLPAPAADSYLPAHFGQMPEISDAEIVFAAPAKHIGKAEKTPPAQTKPNLLHLDDPALIRWLAEHPEDWNNNLRNYLDEQSRKIKSVAQLIDEYDLWNEVEAGKSPHAGFEERVAVSAN